MKLHLKTDLQTLTAGKENRRFKTEIILLVITHIQISIEMRHVFLLFLSWFSFQTRAHQNDIDLWLFDHVAHMPDSVPVQTILLFACEIHDGAHAISS